MPEALACNHEYEMIGLPWMLPSGRWLIIWKCRLCLDWYEDDH